MERQLSHLSNYVVARLKIGSQCLSGSGLVAGEHVTSAGCSGSTPKYDVTAESTFSGGFSFRRDDSQLCLYWGLYNKVYLEPCPQTMTERYIFTLGGNGRLKGWSGDTCIEQTNGFFWTASCSTVTQQIRYFDDGEGGNEYGLFTPHPPPPPPRLPVTVLH